MLYDLAIAIYDILVHLAAPLAVSPENDEGTLGGL